jgi:nitrite reductase (NO-forming)
MIKATKYIIDSILWIALTPVFFLITFYLIPSLLVAHAQEMSTNIAFLTGYEPVTIVGNTPLTSQPLPANTSTTTISIVKGGADPNNEQFYVPKMVNVTVGATVKWKNDDPIPHTVTSGTPEDPTKEFDSGFINMGDSFTHTFDKKGLFEYFCMPHPWMTGKVTVD